MELTIRRATMKDYEPLCAVLAEGDALHSEHLPDRFCTPPQNQAARSHEYIAGLLSDPDSSVLVAEYQSQIVGAIVTVMRDAAPIPILAPRRFATIDIVVVTQEMQSKGIGRALMNQAEQWARSRGASDIELSVYFFNQKAERFYTALGYEGLLQKMVKKL